MISHPRAGRSRRAVDTSHAHHQTGASPVSQSVERRGIRILASVSITGQMRIDEPGIDRCKIFPRQTEFLEQHSLIISQEHVRSAYQTQQNLAAFRTAEIERDALLVAIGQ